MSAHTPGPWCVIGKQGTAVWAGDKIVSQMSEPRAGHKVARANAVLIAAAPELLQALMQANAQMEMAADCIANGRFDEALLHVSSMGRHRLTAIAKARGEA